MPTLTIDGQEVTVEPGTTILQACEQVGVEIPRFCYHERLSIAGNCRMCLVAMERSPKPVASCAMPAGDKMVIHTNTPEVRKARQGVMEFLLINHPLDCPICDQGGECDLQDQSMAYGMDHSRFHENKRAVEEKYMGPLIKTFMTRCIHCTRCIRFATEIAGVEELGATGRGEDTEITTYVEQALHTELAGNLVDVCPVGALTSRPYAFNARPWELRKIESIDAHDAVGSNIRVDVRGREVMRVLPRLHEDVNEEWISDKTRHAVDGLRRQRLDRPYVRRDGKLVEASWGEAFQAIADKAGALAPNQIAAIAGDMVDAEAMFALKQLMDALGSPNLDCRQDGAKLDDAGGPAGWRFNTTIAGIEDADACLLVGTDPRFEASLINARIRKRWLEGGFPVGVIGPDADLKYKTKHLGAGPASLSELAGGGTDFAAVLDKAERPMLIVGMGALARDDGAAVLKACADIAAKYGMVGDEWNGFNVLHTAASRVAGLALGLLPGEGGRNVAGILDGAASGDVGLVWLLGADEIDTAKLKNAFVVYQGHHGDAGAHVADVILPGAAYTEKDGLWMNTEGRVQLGRRAAFPPGEARDDWSIIRAASERLGHTLPYDNLQQLRQKLVEAVPAFGQLDTIEPATFKGAGAAGDMADAAFVSPVADFFMTNAICRASDTMAQCSRIMAEPAEATGTDG
ncbi:MAG: NADH-quinone oxidoreductase subunit NuoG [Alphaproteobacteria bacterium]